MLWRRRGGESWALGHASACLLPKLGSLKPTDMRPILLLSGVMRRWLRHVGLAQSGSAAWQWRW